MIDFGTAKLLLLPAESYVEYQLLAQKLCPDAFVLTMGYGECAAATFRSSRRSRRATNLSDWCWVAPGCEKAMREAMQLALMS